jgi:FlaA1/EpsC-like NDP-sugar epimerase
MNSFVGSLSGWALFLWQAFLVIGASGGWFFVVAYHIHTKGRWRHGRMGRHLMHFSTAVSLALTVYILRIVVGNFPGRGALMFFTLIYLVVVVWWRAALFLLENRRERREQKDEVV